MSFAPLAEMAYLPKSSIVKATAEDAVDPAVPPVLPKVPLSLRTSCTANGSKCATNPWKRRAESASLSPRLGRKAVRASSNAFSLTRSCPACPPLVVPKAPVGGGPGYYTDVAAPRVGAVGRGVGAR